MASSGDSGPASRRPRAAGKALYGGLPEPGPPGFAPALLALGGGLGRDRVGGAADPPRPGAPRRGRRARPPGPRLGAPGSPARVRAAPAPGARARADRADPVAPPGQAAARVRPRPAERAAPGPGRRSS